MYISQALTVLNGSFFLEGTGTLWKYKVYNSTKDKIEELEAEKLVQIFSMNAL